MRLVLLGAPGSGKGTQAARLKEHLQVPHISTGDLLRAEVAASSPLGLAAKEVMARGELVSDAILLGMLEDRLSRPDTAGGFILDGYPRNLAQADALDVLLKRIGQPMDAAVQRCKAIVSGILMSAGEARGEAPQITTMRAAFGEIVAHARAARRGTRRRRLISALPSSGLS